MMKSVSTISVVVMSVLSLSAQNVAVQSATPVRAQGNQHPVVVNDLSHFPDLSMEQAQQLRSVMDEFAVNEARIRGEMHGKVSQMEELQSLGDSEQVEVDRLSSALRALREELEQRLYRRHETVAEILTPEQMFIYSERGLRWEIELRN